MAIFRIGDRVRKRSGHGLEGPVITIVAAGGPDNSAIRVPSGSGGGQLIQPPIELPLPSKGGNLRKSFVGRLLPVAVFLEPPVSVLNTFPKWADPIAEFGFRPLAAVGLGEFCLGDRARVDHRFSAGYPRA